MRPPKAENPQETTGRPTAVPKDFLDLKVLSRALREFNVSRTHAAMYPPEHPQIARSIERAYEYLCALTAKIPTLTLGIANDCLMFGGECLDPKSGIFREFANFLSSRDIVSVTFLQGLTKEEIIQFHSILNANPEAIRDAGGMLEMMRAAGFAHLQVQAVDYRYFHLTEEEEIRQKKAGKEEERAIGGLWQDFVHHLVAGRLSREERSISREAWESLDPVKLAQFINEYRLDPRSIAASYEEFLRGQLHEFCDHETMAKLEILLRNLRPELKKQFLSITFDYVQEQPQEVLAGFSEGFLVEIIEQAREEGKGISPTLISMIHSLANIEGAMPTSPDELPIPDGNDAMSPPSEKEMQKLLGREDYEAYVDEEYSATLTRLSDGRPQGPSPLADVPSGQQEVGSEETARDRQGASVPQTELKDSLEDGQLAVRICEMLLALLGEKIDPDDYEVFSRKLVEFVPELLDLGEIQLVLQIISLLRRQTADASEMLRAMAMKATEDMAGFTVANKAVEAYRRFRETNGRGVTALVYAIGGNCVPGLVDLYVDDDFSYTKKAVEQILIHFLRETLDEVYSRLFDNQERVVRTLLSFILHHGNADAIPHVRPLLNHPNHSVRMDALTTLLVFGDPVAVDSLRKALQSPFSEESMRAIGLAGLCRVADLVDDLTKMITFTAFRRSHHRRNEEIVKALGKIGDPRVISVLERLARRSWVIFPSEHGKVKLALFESLAGYPKESLVEILAIGRESKDFQIRAIANAFLKDGV
ncbi:MAG TPA: hypothetical protein DCZ69_05655 [Syntrophobacteraceae bacterium]|nr:hypothetical protein [Syntrophobacteraceae bacterium]